MDNENLVFEKLSQDLTANQEWRTLIAGDFFRVTKALYPVTVAVIKDGRIRGVMKNIKAGDKVDGLNFDGVVVTNGANAQTVEVQISSGGASSDSVLGEVSVINGELAKVLAARSFTGLQQISGVAGQYSHIQLKNVSTTKNLVVTQAFSSNRANTFSEFSHCILTSGVSFATLGGNPKRCKLSGGADSTAAEIRAETNPVRAVAGINFYVGNSFYGNVLKFNEPIVLQPNHSLVVMSETLAEPNFCVSFDWYEENI